MVATIICPHCQRRLQCPEEKLKQRLRCPICKKTFLAELEDPSEIWARTTSTDDPKEESPEVVPADPAKPKRAKESRRKTEVGADRNSSSFGTGFKFTCGALTALGVVGLSILVCMGVFWIIGYESDLDRPWTVKYRPAWALELPEPDDPRINSLDYYVQRDLERGLFVSLHRKPKLIVKVNRFLWERKEKEHPGHGNTSADLAAAYLRIVGTPHDDPVRFEDAATGERLFSVNK